MEEDYIRLQTGWVMGDRNRERSLHLLFLAWWHWAEPQFLTGLSDDPAAVEIWHAIFKYFGGEYASDAEFLYVASIMAHLFPWVLGDEPTWEATAERMKARSRHLKPEGFSSEVFEGRGEYGKYFAHQSRGRRDWPANSRR